MSCLTAVFWPNENVVKLHKHNLGSWSFFQHTPTCTCPLSVCANVCRTCYPTLPQPKSGTKQKGGSYFKEVDLCRCRLCLQHSSFCKCVRLKCMVCPNSTMRTPSKKLERFFDDDKVDDDTIEENYLLFNFYCDKHIKVCKRHMKIIDYVCNPMCSPTSCEICYCEYIHRLD